MEKGELHKTDDNQHRLILGETSDGDIAFATRGGNVPHDYNSCQIQPLTKFSLETEYVGVVPLVDFQRVKKEFAKYISSNNIS